MLRPGRERIFSGEKTLLRKNESSREKRHFAGRENLLGIKDTSRKRESSQLFSHKHKNQQHHTPPDKPEHTHASQSMYIMHSQPDSQPEEIVFCNNLLIQGKKGETCLNEMVSIFNERLTSAQTNYQRTVVESKNASQAVSDAKKNKAKYNTEWRVAKEDILGLNITISRFQRKVKSAELEWLYAGTPHSAFEDEAASALDVIHKKFELETATHDVMKLQKDKVVAIAERDLAMSNTLATRKTYAYLRTWARCAKRKQATAVLAMETAKEDALIYQTVLNEHPKHPPQKKWQRWWPSQSRGGHKVYRPQPVRLNECQIRINKCNKI